MEFISQTDLFNHIWNTRPHVSEVSGEELFQKGHRQWHWQFSHILGKGLYGGFKLREDNIVLITPDEHYIWGNQSYKIRSDPKWRWVFEKYDQLKIEYHSKGK